MREIEITDIPPLAAGQRTLVEMHGVLNVLNVLRGELTLIGLTLANDDGKLARGLETCDHLIEALRAADTSVEMARNLESHLGGIRSEIEQALSADPDKRAEPEILESLGNLESVFSILRVRGKEILARVGAAERWEKFSVEGLRGGFLAVFAAIEKNSRGRYRLLYNLALQEPLDYYIDLKIESAGGSQLWMPPVFEDVMRDLIANARKYTSPGGKIAAALHAGEQSLRFCVEDTGRGIPENEIQTVVEFGRRASNVGDVRTMGGGFGLTKAFLVTKQFGGRFFIASRVGVGTRIRIHIPRPAFLA